MQNEIKRLASKFTQLTRADGTKFWMMQSEDHDDVDFDIVRDIHGTDILPDDFRYETIVNLLDRLQDYDFNSVDELRDNGIDHEITDSLVDVYNSDLTTWLASHLSRADFCNEAVSEGLSDGSDIFKTIQAGQYLEISEILNRLLAHLESVQNEISLGE